MTHRHIYLKFDTQEQANTLLTDLYPLTDDEGNVSIQEQSHAHHVYCVDPLEKTPPVIDSEGNVTVDATYHSGAHYNLVLPSEVETPPSLADYVVAVDTPQCTNAGVAP